MNRVLQHTRGGGVTPLLRSHRQSGQRAHPTHRHPERSQESLAGKRSAQAYKDSERDTPGAPRPFDGAEAAGYIRYRGPPAHCSPSATVHVQRLVCQSLDSMAVCLGSC